MSIEIIKDFFLSKKTSSFKSNEYLNALLDNVGKKLRISNA